MADSTSYDVAIYRCTDEGDTEGSLPNLEAIGMDYGITDQSVRGVMIYTWETPDRQTDNPNPANRVLSKPDTGISNITLTVGIKFNEKDADDPKVGTLTKWGIEAKTVRGVFNAGRFGVRNNKKDWMDFQPTLQSGWKIIDVNMDDILQYGGLVDCLVTLQFAGVTQDLATEIAEKGG